MNHWEDPVTSVGYSWSLPNPLKSLRILFRPDNAVIIFAAGLLYVAYTCINASLSILFIEMYNLTQLEAGLIYLPFGIGGIVSTFFSGHLIDRAYYKARIARGLTTDRVGGDNLDTFAIEKARIAVIWAPMVLTVGSIVAFGWTLQYRLVRISISI